MPIYEFYCRDCHTVFNFRSHRIDTTTRPACPRCARPELSRRLSPFAISKGRKEKTAAADPLASIDETRLERALEGLAGEMEGVDENDPRQAAGLMRKMFEATGLGRGPAVDEMLRRMEAGEDPDALDAELGDRLEQEMLADGEPKTALARLRRRLRPPEQDPKLYEL